MTCKCGRDWWVGNLIPSWEGIKSQVVTDKASTKPNKGISQTEAGNMAVIEQAQAEIKRLKGIA